MLVLLSVLAIWTAVVGIMVHVTFSETFVYTAALDQSVAPVELAFTTIERFAFWMATALIFSFGVLLLFTTLVATFGVVQVSVGPAYVHIFTGLGPIGGRRCIDRAAIRKVAVEIEDSFDQCNCTQIIRIDRPGKETVRFGVALSEEQQQWLADSLADALSQRPPFIGMAKIHAFA